MGWFGFAWNGFILKIQFGFSLVRFSSIPKFNFIPCLYLVKKGYCGGGGGGWLKVTLVLIFGPNLQTTTFAWLWPKLNNWILPTCLTQQNLSWALLSPSLFLHCIICIFFFYYIPPLLKFSLYIFANLSLTNTGALQTQLNTNILLLYIMFSLKGLK